MITPTLLIVMLCPWRFATCCWEVRGNLIGVLYMMGMKTHMPSNGKGKGSNYFQWHQLKSWQLTCKRNWVRAREKKNTSVVQKSVSERHKPNMSGKREHERKRVVMIATKSEMREMRENPNMTHFVLLYKDAILTTNDMTSLPSVVGFHWCFSEGSTSWPTSTSWDWTSNRSYSRSFTSKLTTVPHQSGRNKRNSATSTRTTRQRVCAWKPQSLCCPCYSCSNERWYLENVCWL